MYLGAQDRFVINEETGEISTKGRLPFEDGVEFTLAISAEDIGAPTTITTITQTVAVRGWYRNPQFSQTEYTFKLPESTAVGTK